MRTGLFSFDLRQEHSSYSQKQPVLHVVLLQSLSSSNASSHFADESVHSLVLVCIPSQSFEHVLHALQGLTYFSAAEKSTP